MGRSDLSDEQILKMKELNAAGLSASQISNVFERHYGRSVARGTIYPIVNGHRRDNVVFDDDIEALQDNFNIYEKKKTISTLERLSIVETMQRLGVDGVISHFTLLELDKEKVESIKDEVVQKIKSNSYTSDNEKFFVELIKKKGVFL